MTKLPATKAAICGFAVLFVCVSWLTSRVSAADPKPEKITVATWNLEWFFDNYQGDNRSDLAKKLSAPTRADWDWRLKHTADVIAKLQPTILCLQEVENQQVVYYLRKKLEEEHELKYRIAFIQGYDFYTEQDVAILYQSGLVEFSRKEQSQEMFDSKKYYNVNKHLFARFEWGTAADKQSLHIVTAHLRATPEKEDLRKKQARLLHTWMKEKLDAGENVIMIGDFNSEHDIGKEPADSDIGILRGLETETTKDDLTDVSTKLAAEQHATHMNGRAYDRILVSQSILDDGEGKDMVLGRAVNRKDLVIRGEPDEDHRDVYFKIDAGERDLSDHYPLMCELLFK